MDHCGLCCLFFSLVVAHCIVNFLCNCCILVADFVHNYGLDTFSLWLICLHMYLEEQGVINSCEALGFGVYLIFTNLVNEISKDVLSVFNSYCFFFSFAYGLNSE